MYVNVYQLYSGICACIYVEHEKVDVRGGYLPTYLPTYHTCIHTYIHTYIHMIPFSTSQCTVRPRKSRHKLEPHGKEFGGNVGI